MAIRTVYDMSFEEEKKYNNPLSTLEWLADTYHRTTDDNNNFIYRDRPIKFVNTHLASKAAKHFQTYARYNDINPKTNPRQWKEWWDRWEYRRKEGITLPIGIDASGGISDKDLIDVWLTGEHVGMLNFGPILRAADDEDEYGLKDSLINSAEIAESLNNVDKAKYLFKKIGERTVVNITTDFPDFWDGHFHFWSANEFSKRMGLDITVLKARRKGYSLVAAWDCVTEVDLVPGSTVILIAFDKKYLTGPDALVPMIRTYLDHLYQHTDWSKRRIVDNSEGITLGFKYRGSDVVHGYKSSIIFLSAMNNPSVARGKIATKIKWEECGSFPNLIETVESTKSASESGGYVLGHSSYWGTAGADDSEFGPFSKLYLNPRGFDCLPIDFSQYSPKKKGRSAGFFHSQLLNYAGFIDKDGNSDIEGARIEHEKRKKKKEENSDARAFNKWVAERPTSPEDVLDVNVHNIFARHHKRLRDQLDRLNSDPAFFNFGDHGQFLETKKGIKFMTNPELKEMGLPYHPPIDDVNRNLPKNFDMYGCTTIWHYPHRVNLPVENSQIYHTGLTPMRTVIPDDLYYIWHDPYATDKDAKDINVKDSVGAAYVYERTSSFVPGGGDRLVARLVGRPERVEQYNYQLLLLAKFFNINGNLQFENDRGTVYEYFLRKKSLSLLAKEPELLSMKDLVGGKTGRKYGISIGKHPRRKSEAALLFRDHLGTPRGLDQESGIFTTFIESIYCKRLLLETMNWKSDPKFNFDCVSAMLVGMWYLQEIADITLQESDAINQAQEDDFFNRTFF